MYLLTYTMTVVVLLKAVLANWPIALQSCQMWPEADWDLKHRHDICKTSLPVFILEIVIGLR